MAPFREPDMPFAMQHEPAADLGETLVGLCAAEGSAGHPYTHSFELNADPLATRNLADVLHLLSMLHGAQPGMIELAGGRNVCAAADSWFTDAAAGFAAERAYLTQLIVVAGPAPSTPGEPESGTTVLGQRHALETIALSDRFGCAVGATAALLLDWQAIRSVLDTAADRIGIAAPPVALPDEVATSDMLAGLSEHPRFDRAVLFGARQLLVQHHGLWTLLETRAAARAAQ